jgi:hypothetical protein
MYQGDNRGWRAGEGELGKGVKRKEGEEREKGRISEER